jgi:hypothetical protein
MIKPKLYLLATPNSRSDLKELLVILIKKGMLNDNYSDLDKLDL